MALTLSVTASLLVVAMVTGAYVRRRTGLRQKQTDTAVILEDMPGFQDPCECNQLGVMVEDHHESTAPTPFNSFNAFYSYIGLRFCMISKS